MVSLVLEAQGAAQAVWPPLVIPGAVLVEGLVGGRLRQGVIKMAIFTHGSTKIYFNRIVSFLYLFKFQKKLCNSNFEKTFRSR